MPQQNAWIGGHAGFNPFGQQLQTVFHPGRQAYRIAQRANKLIKDTTGYDPFEGKPYNRQSDRDRFYDDKQPYKRQRLDPSSESMPVSRARRYRPRRAGRRRIPRRYKRRRQTFPRELWPRMKLVRLKSTVSNALYHSAGTWDGTNGWRAIKANSLNDPWGTLSSALPLGLDQLANLYQKYVVVASTIVIDAHPSSITGGGRIGLALRNNNTDLASADYYGEVPMSIVRVCSGDIDVMRLAMRYKAKKFWKVRKFMDAEDQQATFTTTPGDPTDIAYYHFWIHDLNANEAMTVEFKATITFDLLLFDPVIPSRSSL